MIDDEVQEWLRKAGNDVKIVEHELKLPEEEIVKDGVCFHSQQAVEKFLKAFLINNDKKFIKKFSITKNIKIEKIHSIENLLSECSSIDKDFANIEIKKLSKFAVDIRYPCGFSEPNIEEVKFYYELVKKIRDLVLKKFKIT